MKFNTCALVVQLLTQNSQAIRLDQNQNQHQKSATGAKDPIDNVYIAGSKETWNPKLQIYSLLQEGAKNAAVSKNVSVQKQSTGQKSQDQEQELIVSNFVQLKGKNSDINVYAPKDGYQICKNFWGLDPNSHYPPVCESRGSIINEEANKALTPSGPVPRTPVFKSQKDAPQAGEAPERPKEPETGSVFPAVKENIDKTAQKKMDGVIVGDKKDTPVIVSRDQYKNAQEQQPPLPKDQAVAQKKTAPASAAEVKSDSKESTPAQVKQANASVPKIPPAADKSENKEELKEPQAAVTAAKKPEAAGAKTDDVPPEMIATLLHQQLSLVEDTISRSLDVPKVEVNMMSQQPTNGAFSNTTEGILESHLEVPAVPKTAEEKQKESQKKIKAAEKAIDNAATNANAPAPAKQAAVQKSTVSTKLSQISSKK